MAGTSKLELGEKMMTTQKISVSDHANGAENSDSFVIDMETFCHGSGKDPIPNSRITLQRNLSRKGSQRGGEKKMSSNSTSANDRDTIVASTSSTRVETVGERIQKLHLAADPGACSTGTPDSSPVAANLTEPSSQVHQITVNSSTTGVACAEGRAFVKRNSFRRASSSWGLDPRRILIMFASLSSIGTMLLIYFTLSASSKAEENALELDWQQ